MEDSDDSSSASHQKRKREDSTDDGEYMDEDSVDDDKSSSSEDEVDAPQATNGIVDFNLSSLVIHFTCLLCNGLYKDPVTLNECLHSFCKSCIFSVFATGEKNCPTCEVFLGADPYKVALNDRTLESLSDKVLFPSVKERDEIEEKKFYASRGILPKPELESRDTSPEKAAPIPEADDELDFLLSPDVQADDQHKLPQLERSCIKTSGRLKIVQLKKYLLRKLELSPKLLSSVGSRIPYQQLSCCTSASMASHTTSDTLR